MVLVAEVQMRGWGLGLQQQVRQRLLRQARWQKRLLLVQVLLRLRRERRGPWHASRLVIV